MFGVVVTLLAVVLLAYFVIKNYYPPVILLVLALVLLLIGRATRRFRPRPLPTSLVLTLRRPLRILRRAVSAVWASTSWPSAASLSI